RNRARWLLAGAAALLLTTLVACGGLVTVLAHVFAPRPVASVAGRTYLCDLTPLDGANWLSKPPPPPKDDFKKKGPPPIEGVQIGGEPFPRGLFMHPPRSPLGGTTKLTYRLDRPFTTFHP